MALILWKRGAGDSCAVMLHHTSRWLHVNKDKYFLHVQVSNPVWDVLATYPLTPAQTEWPRHGRLMCGQTSSVERNNRCTHHVMNGKHSVMSVPLWLIFTSVCSLSVGTESHLRNISYADCRSTYLKWRTYLRLKIRSFDAKSMFVNRHYTLLKM